MTFYISSEQSPVGTQAEIQADSYTDLSVLENKPFENRFGVLDTELGCISWGSPDFCSPEGD